MRNGAGDGVLIRGSGAGKGGVGAGQGGDGIGAACWTRRGHGSR